MSDVNAELVRLAESVSNLHIVESESLERILFDRNLIGYPFRQACLDASAALVRAAWVTGKLSADMSELLLLSKGLVYALPFAYGQVTGRNLETNVIGARRAEVDAEGARIETPYARLDAGGSHLLIGDTVATGSTICAALELYSRVHTVESVTVLSFAGTGMGAENLNRFCEARGISLGMFFGLAAFGVAPNGFDLSFNNPATQTAKRYRERASAQFDGQQVSAVGWDFGSQAHAVSKYRALTWVEAEVSSLHGHPSLATELVPDDWSVLGYERMAYGESAPQLPQEPFREGG